MLFSKFPDYNISCHRCHSIPPESIGKTEKVLCFQHGKKDTSGMKSVK